MSKILAEIFPILDHLYIYQILEYDFVDFLGWFIKHPFKRNLQVKHKLQFSKKAIALFLGTIFWELFSAYFLSLQFSKSILFFLILFQLITPIFIILSHLTYLPFEIYLKGEILDKTKQKLNHLPNLKIVAITGSFGKTSTKDMLYTLLWKDYSVVKTPKSFNTPLGIAQTILEDVKSNTQILIAEIGAYREGEIAKIAKIIKPQIGIITAVAPQHLERFGSLENIASAKFELAENLTPGGLAVLNNEYGVLKSLSGNLRGLKIKFYGQDSSIYATDIKTGIDGTNFNMHTPRGTSQIKIPLIGEHHVSNFLAAATAAMQIGLSLKEIRDRANLLLPTPHRLEIRKQKGLTIIDNTYNTNPKAAQSSLNLLNNYPASQKIIITPGLIELGKEAGKENQALAKNAAAFVDRFIIVGENAKKDLLAGLRTAKFPREKIYLVNSTKEGINLLSKISKPNAVVLLENDLPDQYF
ncbi:UDP-N-acetylmuramoyl-tripeptide--D-alanyl-D-alanine ligase [Candidatus Daviesbacteria bacterium]|nr:UDP-N-acetylmuramoyl-tripeptide--D-alanyl-D-alanine ligase [Candidatus Daviesbacteria bacterium]